MSRDRTTLALPAVLGLVLTLLVGLAAPALAARSIARDEAGDGRLGTDLRKVTIDHRENRISFKLRMADNPRTEPDEAPEVIYYFVDTGGDALPEFVVRPMVKNELADEPATYVFRFVGDDWPKKSRPWEAAGAEVDCGLKVTKKLEDGELVKTVIGRGCLKTDGVMPERIRTTAGGRGIEYSWEDHVGGWTAYGPWTRAA